MYDIYQNRPIKTEKEFVKESVMKNPGYIVLVVLSIICDIVATVLIIPPVIKIIEKNSNTLKALKYWNVSNEELLVPLVIGVLVILLGSILMACTKIYERRAVNEYHQYLMQFQSSSQSSRTYFTSGVRPQGNSLREWRCKNCGRVNQHYVGTCACGEMSPARIKQNRANEVSVQKTSKQEKVTSTQANNTATASTQTSTKSVRIRPWYCPSCGKLNEANAEQCQCGEERPILKS